MGTITSADIVFSLSIVPLFLVPQRIQGFASDDVTDVPTIRSVEVLMGVDGVLSGGFVNKEFEQHVALQADSLSNDVFETWWTQQQANNAVYRASGVLSVPSIGKEFNFVQGFLTGYKPLPPVRRLLQPRVYGLTWQKVVPVPL